MSRARRVLALAATAAAAATIAAPNVNAYASDVVLHPRAHHVTPHIDMYVHTSGSAGWAAALNPGTEEVRWDKASSTWQINKCVESGGHAVGVYGSAKATLPSSRVDVAATLRMYTGASCNSLNFNSPSGTIGTQHFTLNVRGTTTDKTYSVTNVANSNDYGYFYLVMGDA
ncbi:hypothetical protein [Streptomyces sp. NPDC057909]|uniref:hypothetical protein n=1 Tax=Streptomyces sp. NPDC057909 TaxID=3346277 RepID=UPI0036F13720